MDTQHPFFEHIREQHPNPTQFSDFLEASKRPLRKSIRVNTLKISVDDFKLLALKRNWQLQSIPWCAEGFWIEIFNETSSKPDDTYQLGNSIYHLMGLFYIQEASSMLPASMLSRDGRTLELVLDMAAAPGSKTTQLAALMQNHGTILANELSSSRVKVLHSNLTRMGTTNSCLNHGDGVNLAAYFQQQFDAILLDAPCSGEGTLRKDPKALANWSFDAIESISTLQKSLLQSAWNMLKPEGRLIYSTCTLSRAENHDVIRWLQQQFSDVEIESLSNAFPEASQAITAEGFLHLWPEIFDCEGFFVASLKKKPEFILDERALKDENGSDNKYRGQSKFSELSTKELETIAHYYQNNFGYDIADISARLRVRAQQHERQVWLFPEFDSKLKQYIKIQRSGLRVCDLIESRSGLIFKTQHEFISSFGKAFTKQIVELNEAETIIFYKGENINSVDAGDKDMALTKGECLVRHLGFPVGIAKVILNKNTLKIKNNLPRNDLRSHVHP